MDDKPIDNRRLPPPLCAYCKAAGIACPTDCDHADQLRAYGEACAAAAVAAERERWEAVAFDGWRVLKHLDEQAARRTSHENVSDTLDAFMRAIRAQPQETT
jgi:hypothetical protein